MPLSPRVEESRCFGLSFRLTGSIGLLGQSCIPDIRLTKCLWLETIVLTRNEQAGKSDNCVQCIYGFTEFFISYHCKYAANVNRLTLAFFWEIALATSVFTASLDYMTSFLPDKLRKYRLGVGILDSFSHHKKGQRPIYKTFSVVN